MDFSESSLRRYLVIVLVACGISLALAPVLQRDSGVERATGADEAAPITSADQLTIKLAQEVDRKDQLGIAVRELGSDQTYALADDRKFDAASTMKVLFAAYMYHQASNDEFDLDEEITIPASQVQRYGTGSIQYEAGPYTYTYRELAKRMMHESDNTAAFVLANKLEQDKLQEYAEYLGLKDTSVEGNTTTPRDMMNLFAKLYNKELADSALSTELLEFTRHTEFEDRIPARLPAEATVYHKTGDAFDGGFHDVGVVEYQGKKYAVAIFGQGLSKEDLADMSRHIFTYMTR